MTEIAALTEAVMMSLEKGASLNMPSAWLQAPASEELVRISLPIRMEDEVVLIRVVIMALNALVGEMPVVVTVPVGLDAHGHLTPIDYEEEGGRELLLLVSHLGGDTTTAIYQRHQGVWLQGQEVEPPWRDLTDIKQTLEEGCPMYQRVLDILCEAGLITRH